MRCICVVCAAKAGSAVSVSSKTAIEAQAALVRSADGRRADGRGLRLDDRRWMSLRAEAVITLDDAGSVCGLVSFRSHVIP